MAGNFEIDYAYVKGDTTEFGTAHIMLFIGNTCLKLVIQVKEEISIPDLETLLKDLQNVQLKRMNIFIPTECEVFVQVKEKKMRIIFAESEQLVIDSIVEAKDD